MPESIGAYFSGMPEHYIQETLSQITKAPHSPLTLLWYHSQGFMPSLT